MESAIYEGRQVALATKHGKERVLTRPMKAALGLEVVVPAKIETDAFGTFTGEIERPGSPLRVLLYKARLGLKQTGLKLGLANEGSFYPHPAMPFVTVDDELMVFIDEEIGLNIVERLVAAKTNYTRIKVQSMEELKDFLRRVCFPSHAVIVRPNDRLTPDFIFKGLNDFEAVKRAVEICLKASNDRTAHIETDMRAHLNPTRMRVIRQLAFKLARRLKCLCPICSAPGFGLIKTESGLPCRSCQTPTELLNFEIHGCQKCSYEMKKMNTDLKADRAYCSNCNP
ncbi:MAG: hypothetical protein LUM44_07795 [Pyrinomonadaceae bacterium]|nr:hypothetical protein [Pyrinomonadaceae bacterium]